MNEKLLAQVRYYFAQCVFMNSIHYKAYYRVEGVLARDQNIVKTVSASTLIVIILNLVLLDTDVPFDTFYLRILYLCGLALTGFSLIYELFSKKDIGELKFQHRSSAEDYKVLRDQYMTLIEEIMSSSMKEKDIRLKLERLQEKYAHIGKASPATESSDYAKAQSGLGIADNNDEEFTWSDSEIDRFLPVALRISV